LSKDCHRTAIRASAPEDERINPEIKDHCVGGKSAFRPSDSKTRPGFLIHREWAEGET